MKKRYMLLTLFLGLFFIGGQGTFEAETQDELINSNEQLTDKAEVSEDDADVVDEENEQDDADDGTQNDYYEGAPAARSDLNSLVTNRSLFSTSVDTVNAGETNRPKADFIDVSSHNGTITVAQYQMMKTYGIGGVVVKLTEGTTYTNPYAASQIANAQQAGLKVSVYHYSHYTSESGAQAEADYFLATAKTLNLSTQTIMISDIEESSMSNSSINATTLAFRNRLNAAGYKQVMYYLSRSWLDVAGGPFQTATFGLGNIWVAQYPYTSTATQQWNSNFSAWQWSSTFYFPGIAHSFDISTDYLGRFVTTEWDESTPITGTTTAVDVSGNETEFKITTTITAGNYKPYKVWFPVWSETNGQDDLVWYEATENSDGTWSANVDISNHATAGKYFVHTYVAMTANESSKKMVSNTSFEVSSPTLTATIDSSNANSGKFDVIVTPSSKSGVASIQVPVWSQKDQSDIFWYDAVLQNDGSYKASIDSKNHNYNNGTYTAHVYMTANNGTKDAAVVGTVEINKGEMTGETIVTDTSGNETIFTPKLNLTLNGYDEAITVYFATWSIDGGQDDLVWYEGEKQSDGSYTSAIDINKNHKTSGKYAVHTYVSLPNGTMKGINSTEFNVSQPTFSSSINNKNAGDGEFEVVITPSSTSGIDTIQIPVWSKNDQSDIVWYTAEKQDDDTYKVIVKASNHNYNTGKYVAHAYLVAKNGTTYSKPVGSVDVTLGKIKGDTKIVDKNNDENIFKLSTSVTLGGYNEPTNLWYAVWSLEGGQDDLQWYEATRLADGSYAREFSISTHKTAGEYAVHTYANMNGTMVGINTGSFNISMPEIDKPLQTIDNENGLISLSITAKSASGISEIMVPVWSQKDQKDIVWYSASLQEDNTYKVVIDKKNHDSNAKKYYIHVYLTANNGIVSAINAGTAEFGQ